MPLISKLQYGALLAYHPRAGSDVAKLSRRVRDGVKYWHPAVARRAVEILEDRFEGSGLESVLGPDVILVPAPRSSTMVEGALWPPFEICKALVEAGFGLEVVRALERAEAVPKSAFAAPGNRPSAARHYESLRAQQAMLAQERVTIVDDVITKGNTLLGAASRLVDVAPDVKISAFALIRTRGLVMDIEEIVDPVTGFITCYGAEANRDNN